MPKKNRQYKQGVLGAMIRAVCDLYKLDFDHVRASLYHNFPILHDKSRCPNCDAKMEIIEHSADFFDAMLLLKMGERVRKNMAGGMDFTEANMVHIYTLPAPDYVRHRSTKCSYLNLIKQPDSRRNSGTYVITQWGWDALAGKPVPKSATYFRGKLMSRSEETTTLSAMFQSYADRVKQLTDKGKPPKEDYRHEVAAYDPQSWYEVVGYADSGI